MRSRVVRVADSLSQAMRHVVLRCSSVQQWGSTRGWDRHGPDIVHGYPRCSIRTCRALVTRGVLYESDMGFGLTSFGLSVQLELRMRKVVR